MTNVPEYHSLSDAYQTGLENGKALSAATVAELRAEVADLKVRLDREEQDHSRTIGERDRAEEALGDMFTAATGRPAEWSSAWGYPDAIDEVEDHVAVTQRKADAAERRVGELIEIISRVARCSYSVCTQIDLRGRRWSEAYLDQVLPDILATLTGADPT